MQISSDKEILLVVSGLFTDLSAAWFGLIFVGRSFVNFRSLAEFLQFLTINFVSGMVSLLLAVVLVKRVNELWILILVNGRLLEFSTFWQSLLWFWFCVSNSPVNLLESKYCYTLIYLTSTTQVWINRYILVIARRNHQQNPPCPPLVKEGIAGNTFKKGGDSSLY